MIDVAYCRQRLSAMSVEFGEESHPPEHDWFRAGSDETLAQDVIESAFDNGLDPSTAVGLEQTLQAMYLG